MDAPGRVTGGPSSQLLPSQFHVSAKRELLVAVPRRSPKRTSDRGRCHRRADGRRVRSGSPPERPAASWSRPTPRVGEVGGSAVGASEEHHAATGRVGGEGGTRARQGSSPGSSAASCSRPTPTCPTASRDRHGPRRGRCDPSRRRTRAAPTAAPEGSWSGCVAARCFRPTPRLSASIELRRYPRTARHALARCRTPWRARSAPVGSTPALAAARRSRPTPTCPREWSSIRSPPLLRTGRPDGARCRRPWRGPCARWDASAGARCSQVLPSSSHVSERREARNRRTARCARGRCRTRGRRPIGPGRWEPSKKPGPMRSPESGAAGGGFGPGFARHPGGRDRVAAGAGSSGSLVTAGRPDGHGRA
jgi:hypothetical protein